MNVRSADILTLIEGSLQIARNLFIILEEQTSRPPKKPKRNFPSAVFFVGSSHFSRKTSTKDDRCFVIKEGDSVFCSQQQCMDVRATFVSSGLAASSSCKHADLFSDAVPVSFRRSICPPKKLRTTMEIALHDVCFTEGKQYPAYCLSSFRCVVCRSWFPLHQQYSWLLPRKS